MNAFAGIRPNFPRGGQNPTPSFFPWRLQWGLSVFQWGSNPHNPPANFYPDFLLAFHSTQIARKRYINVDIAYGYKWFTLASNVSLTFAKLVETFY